MPVASRAPHWQPVRSTKKMASMALRSATRGLWQPSGWSGPRRQERLDAFPEGVGDSPLIIDGRSGLGRGARPSLGHETNPGGGAGVTLELYAPVHLLRYALNGRSHDAAAA